MIINKTTSRLNKLADLIGTNPPKVYMIDVINGLYKLKTNKGNTVLKTMNIKQFRRWYESLGKDDVVIIDDIQNE